MLDRLLVVGVASSKDMLRPPTFDFLSITVVLHPFYVWFGIVASIFQESLLCSRACVGFLRL